MKKWFWVRQMGTGLLRKKNCDKGGQGIQASMGRIRSEQRLEGGRMLAQCISERSTPGRKDHFTEQGLGGRRMTGVCAENLREGGPCCWWGVSWEKEGLGRQEWEWYKGGRSDKILWSI